MRWGMVMVPAEEEPVVPVLLPAELTGDGLRDMGDGVSVLFPLPPQGEGACEAFEEFLKYSIRDLEYFIAWSFFSLNILK